MLKQVKQNCKRAVVWTSWYILSVNQNRDTMAYEVKLMNDLLQHIEEYVKKNQNADIQQFTLYLRDTVFDFREQDWPDLNDHNSIYYNELPQIRFSTNLTKLFRFASRYLKQIFKEKEFKSIDEYSFLATLLREKQMSKTQLINSQMLEITTGAELIKRLKAKGLIEEIVDPYDRRSKLVMLTAKGRSELLSAFDAMYRASRLITGNLSNEELKTGIEILTKLSQFHQDIFDQDKNESLEQIYEKYLHQDSDD